MFGMLEIKNGSKLSILSSLNGDKKRFDLFSF